LSFHARAVSEVPSFFSFFDQNFVCISHLPHVP
jgi:hypothetical protein